MGNSSFTSNSAVQGGAIYVHEGTVKFDGSYNGCNTGDSCGCAIYFSIGSSLTIMPMCWENNHANLGGAIYV